MSAPAVLSPAARAAVTEAVQRIAGDDPAAARCLRAAVEEAARLIGPRPAVGHRQPVPVGERYRVWSLAGFPYPPMYDPAPVPPRILRVLHTARDLSPLLADLRE